MENLALESEEEVDDDIKKDNKPTKEGIYQGASSPL